MITHLAPLAFLLKNPDGSDMSPMDLFIAGQQIMWPILLLSFNLGVEVGQLAVLSLVLPLVLRARGATWFGERGVKALSVAIAIGGAVWFVARVAAR